MMRAISVGIAVALLVGLVLAIGACNPLCGYDQFDRYRCVEPRSVG